MGNSIREHVCVAGQCKREYGVPRIPLKREYGVLGDFEGNTGFGEYGV